MRPWRYRLCLELPLPRLPETMEGSEMQHLSFDRHGLCAWDSGRESRRVPLHVPRTLGDRPHHGHVHGVQYHYRDVWSWDDTRFDRMPLRGCRNDDDDGKEDHRIVGDTTGIHHQTFASQPPSTGRQKATTLRRHDHILHVDGCS